MATSKKTKKTTKTAKKAAKKTAEKTATKAAKKAVKKAAKKSTKAAAPGAAAEAARQAENIGIVREFLSKCEKNDVVGACGMLSANAVYHNIPLPPIRGRKRIQSTLESAMKWAKDFRAVNVNIAAGGNAVLTERIDSMVIAGIYIELPVMGTFEIHNGRITAWRDYFDLIQMFRQMATGMPGLLKLIPGLG